MKLSWFSTALILLSSSHITAHPQPATEQLSQRDALSILDAPASEFHDHWKRKGGGGGGSKGGGGGSSSSSSSSGSSSSSSGGRTSTGSSGTSGRTSGSSNIGGATSRGSGVTRNYGGGKYYGGGASVPYKPGSNSPSGIRAAPLFGAALLVYPGIWLYGAYAYPYHTPYSFYNRTGRRNRSATTTTSSAPSATATTVPRGIVARMVEIVERQDTGLGVNETKPVTCLCAENLSCGCDENGDNTYLAALIGDGDYSKLNQTLVQVADINGTSTIIINGTLPNGTTAPGGTDDAVSSASASFKITSLSGYAVMVALVGCSVFLV